MDFFEFANFVEDCDEKQMKQIMNVVNTKRKQLSTQKKFSFNVGDKVQFDAGKLGIMEGVVFKIMQKNIKVKCGHASWKVSPNLLQKVS